MLNRKINNKVSINRINKLINIDIFSISNKNRIYFSNSINNRKSY